MTRMRGALLAAALCACVLPASASAATASNGRVAFTAVVAGHSDIVTVKANGKGWTDLTPGDHPWYCSPSWSPDGTKIAFIEQSEVINQDLLRVMNADGSGMRAIPLSRPEGCGSVSWSPDGAWIAYDTGSSAEAIRSDGLSPPIGVNDGGGYHDPKWSHDGSRIVYLSEDGHFYVTPVAWVGPVPTFGDKQRIDTVGHIGAHPDWSPDDSRLVVEWDGVTERSLWTMNSSDGGDPARVTYNPGESDPDVIDEVPSWSPDGRKIVFQRNTYTANGAYIGQGIFVVDASGGTAVELVNADGRGEFLSQPDWQPLPHG